YARVRQLLNAERDTRFHVQHLSRSFALLLGFGGSNRLARTGHAHARAAGRNDDEQQEMPQHAASTHCPWIRSAVRLHFLTAEPCAPTAGHLLSYPHHDPTRHWWHERRRLTPCGNSVATAAAPRGHRDGRKWSLGGIRRARAPLRSPRRLALRP